ncbi:MAG: DUF4157 domain-containing protein [Caldilineales bacterium]
MQREHSPQDRKTNQPATGAERVALRASGAARVPAWAKGLGPQPSTGEPARNGQRVQAKAEVGQTADLPEPSTPVASGVLLVEDDVGELAPGQLHKSDFLNQLEAAVCQTAEAALQGTLWSAAGCPWIEHWFSYYRDRSADHIERAVRLYAPGAQGAAAAAELIPVISERVRQAILVWRDTGEVTGVPEGVSTELPGAASGEPPPDEVARKPLASNGADPAPQAISRRLGSGQPLAGSSRTRMESAFGADFSGVRIHTDATAAALSRNLNARAFTVGQQVAFGRGEYRPGTPVGDALLAHELAHVMQQRGAASLTAQASGASSGALEEEADTSAVGAVLALWNGARGALGDMAGRTMPTLRAGLRLQRCPDSHSFEEKEAAKTKLASLIGQPDTNEAEIIKTIDDLGSDAAEVLMLITPFNSNSSDGQVQAVAGTEAGQRVLERASKALKGGDVVSRVRADQIDKLLVAKKAAAPASKPGVQKDIDRINKAIKADPRFGEYSKVAPPLRLPVEEIHFGQEMFGGVYYNPHMPSDPTKGGEAGRTRVVAWTSKTHRTNYPMIHIEIGPLALSETDNYIRSVMWHEFQHYKQDLAYREPDSRKSADTKTLEAESASSSREKPNAEIEATSIQLADDFAVLNDDEVKSVLRYLADFMAHTLTTAGFKMAAIDRLKASVHGDRAKQDRLLKLIKQLSKSDQTSLKDLTTAIQSDLAPKPKKGK